MLERIIEIVTSTGAYEDFYDTDSDEYGNHFISRQLKCLDDENTMWIDNEEIGYAFINEDQIMFMGFNDEEVGDIEPSKVERIKHIEELDEDGETFLYCEIEYKDGTVRKIDGFND